jgi:renalase
VRIGVVGAGISGLLCAGALRDAGHEVTLFDKGRSPGGRLATRRIGAARLDHGAQFFTVRSDEFAALVAGWERDGVVREWCRGFTRDTDGTVDGHPRYVANGGMNALAKHLARGLDVRCNALVFSVHRRGPSGWDVRLDDNSMHPFDALVVTCPLSQTYSLIVSADITMPDALWRTAYDTTMCLLVTLDSPGAVPEPGGVQTDPNFTFIGDNLAKGVSEVPALTFHASPSWSDAHWNDDTDVALDALAELATPWIGTARVVERHLKKWRFATPRTIWPEACWQPDDAPTLAVAGDAFAGPRVEGASLSGLAAARSVLG